MSQNRMQEFIFHWKRGMQRVGGKTGQPIEQKCRWGLGSGKRTGLLICEGKNCPGGDDGFSAYL